MTRRYRVLRVVTAAACAYEAATIVLDNPRVPTFSTLSSRHRWLAPVVVGALIFHLAVMPKPQPQGVST